METPQNRPDGPQSPGPQSPGPQSSPPSPGPPTSAPATMPPSGQPAHAGPVPPGGWQQPIAQQPSALAGQTLASWGSRLGAFLVDALIIAIPSIVLLTLIGGGIAAVGDDGSGAGLGALIGGAILTVLAIGAISLLYAPLLMKREGAHNGQTWGKQLLNIRVIRNNGQRMSFGAAALREVVLKQLAVGIASSIIPLLPFLLNYLWPLWDDDNQALHDMAASTHVVRA